MISILAIKYWYAPFVKRRNSNCLKFKALTANLYASYGQWISSFKNVLISYFRSQVDNAITRQRDNAITRQRDNLYAKFLNWISTFYRDNAYIAKLSRYRVVELSTCVLSRYRVIALSRYRVIDLCFIALSRYRVIDLCFIALSRYRVVALSRCAQVDNAITR